ncbi:MAG: hypothetical protein IPM74_18520 [Crocinitomicaceae bacterium]|nr:hypothetical protein [Crocinitomicaceae bacterium]
MRKTLCIISVLFFSAKSFAQTESFVIKSMVHEDTVLLRWAPTSVDLFVLCLQNGMTIERVPDSSSFENNSAKISHSILPFSERKNLITSTNDKTQSYIQLIESFLSQKQPDPNANKMVFAMLMLGSSTDLILAELCGVFYRDIQVKNEAYTYRLSINKTRHQSTIHVNASQLDKDIPMSTLNVSAKPKIKQAYLSWESKSLQTDYAAYWVERSDDSIHFERVNEVPQIFIKSQDEPNKTHCDFVDTSVTEGQTYYYRICAINYFAETGASSNVVKVYIPKSLYGEVRISHVDYKENIRLISGEFVPFAKSDKADKFLLYRSDSIAFGYDLIDQKINENNDFGFSVSIPQHSGDRYYYKVAAVSEDHDTIYSFSKYVFTLDQIPPQTPSGLTGIINDSGVVRLTWELNNENDIRGYRVFRSNALKEEFIEVTQSFCIDSVFYDTLALNNLTPEIYYRISAVDLNYNNSPKTSPVKLMKPDTIAPVSAVLHDFETTSAGVTLRWYNSSSADVKMNQLIRLGENEKTILLVWSDSTCAFQDTTGVGGEEYTYYVTTIDQSANQTLSEKITLDYETGRRAGITNFTAEAKIELKEITLNWKLPAAGEIYSIQIYRAKNDGGFILYKTLRDVSLTTFADKAISPNNIYRYKIKLVYSSGVSSPLSEVAEVMY